jgi:hypothetical protein
MNILDVLIKTRKPLSADEIRELEKLGLHIVASQGKNQYRVRGTTQLDASALETLRFVVASSRFDPVLKLGKGLKAKVSELRKISDLEAMELKKPVTILVSIDPQFENKTVRSELDKLGEVKEISGKRALVVVESRKIMDLVALPLVVKAEEEYKYEAMNNVARTLTKIDPVATTTLGLDGSGETVGVADTGLDNGLNDATMLADFRGRIVDIRDTVNKAAFGVADGADLNNHGTHVCGSILSDGANSNGNLRGMAPAARLSMLAMGPDNSLSLNVPIDLQTGVFQDAYNDNARLHSNSWGMTALPGWPSIGGEYTLKSEDVDEFTRDNPDMLIVFSAGNEGQDGAGSVTPPGTAKNCLTVGACESVRPLPASISINIPQDHDHNPATANQPVGLTIPDFDDDADNVEDIADFSGRGPTDDNRVKPDIVAPGTFILSCRSQVSIADVGPDGLPHNANLDAFYADDSDGVPTHAEAVAMGLPGALFYGAWSPNSPICPPGSGANCQQNYCYMSGTSMATPITTGALALLRQYLRQRRGIDTPSAALMKALIINGATVPPGASNDPDNDRGFGWLNMENTLIPEPTGQQSYSDDVDLAVQTNQSRNFSVQLAQTGHPFRATLVWSDREGSGIQNELYLRITTPASTVIEGDTSAYPTVENNVQRVHIDTPDPGIYNIEVRGVNVPFGIDAHLPAIRQDFAVAVINGIGFSPNPVDICQVIDKSGSMGTYGYIDPVRERSKQMVDIMRINDRIGAVAFNGTSSLVHSVVPIDGFPLKETIKTSISGLGSSGVTSIGAGLQQGQSELTSGGDPSHPQAIILLSDGHENTPPWVGGGVTDSPPNWYAGTNLTEILPTLPASTKVYTVSLGVQSDQVLLQDIATSTGGTFHAINSPADIGELHEIYVHLQALTGGEEVIASGSDQVQGIATEGFSGGGSPGAGGYDGSATLYPLEKVVNLRNYTIDPDFFKRYQPRNDHEIPVDETLSSVTMIVSWHDPAKPVSLTLVSPSGKVYHPGSPLILNHTGTSYQYYYVEKPEPGTWVMQVKTSKSGNNEGLHAAQYTWGAFGRSPISLQYKIPKKLAGVREIKIATSLQGSEHVQGYSLNSVIYMPTWTEESLIEKYQKILKTIDIPKPDNPKASPDLYRLPLLDRKMRQEGKGSIFSTRKQRIKLTRENKYISSIELKTSGLHKVTLNVRGKTRKGFPYQRQTLAYFQNKKGP